MPIYPRDFNDNPNLHRKLIPRWMVTYKDCLFGMNCLSRNYSWDGNIQVHGFPKKYDIIKNRVAAIGTTLQQFLVDFSDDHPLHSDAEDIQCVISWSRIQKFRDEIEY